MNKRWWHLFLKLSESRKVLVEQQPGDPSQPSPPGPQPSPQPPQPSKSVLEVLIDTIGDKNVTVNELLELKIAGKYTQLFDQLKQSSHPDDKIAYDVLYLAEKFGTWVFVAVGKISNFEFIVYSSFRESPYVYVQFPGKSLIVVTLQERLMFNKAVYDALLLTEAWELQEIETDCGILVKSYGDTRFVGIPKQTLFTIYIDKKFIDSQLDAGEFWQSGAPIMDIIRKSRAHLVPSKHISNNIGRIFRGAAKMLRAVSTNQDACYKKTGMVKLADPEQKLTRSMWKELLRLVS